MSGDAEIIIVENDSRNSRLISLGEILKNRFIIPVYQRPYAWNSENFKDLLTTIRESREQSLPAFFGSIIVAEQESSQFARQYILIDGQQRITSFLILLKLIRDKLDVLVKDLTEKRKNTDDNSEVDKIVVEKNEVEKIIESIVRILSDRERLIREAGNKRDGALIL